MKLYIFRHGQAESSAPSDAERALTKRGQQDVANMIAQAEDELVGLDQIWVSPYLRAQQTAQIVISELELGSMPVTTELLVPESQPAELYEQLQLCDADALLLVSHQPLVGHLLEDLCGAEAGRYPMGTASLACVELEVAASGVGQLRWLRHRADV